MAFLEIIKPVRLTEEANAMIEKLIKLYPYRFEGNRSAVIRAAIVKLYRMEVDLNGKRKNKDFQP